MRRVLATLFTVTLCMTVSAQLPKLTGTKSAPGAAFHASRVEMTGKNTGKVIVTITPSKGWHVYGLEIAEGGPKPMVIDLGNSTGVKFKGKWSPSVAPVKCHDDMFGMDVTYWDSKVDLIREFEVTDPAVAKISGTVTYQGCNGNTCNPPERRNIFLKIPAGK